MFKFFRLFEFKIQDNNLHFSLNTPLIFKIFKDQHSEIKVIRQIEL